MEPLKIAAIIHDKDMNEEGNSVEKHVHVVLQFENQRSLERLAKLLNEPQISSFQQWRGNVNNAYSYLVHQTKEAKGKYQYQLEEVKANFDYPTLMSDITKKIEQKNKMKDSEIIKSLLDQLGADELSKDEVILNLTGSQFAKAKKQINDVYQQVQEQKSKVWLEEQKSKNEPITVIWIYGGSGTGKTALAKKYADEQNVKYFITGSSRDSFQHYDGEHLVILDELRPTTFNYDDLLKMLDPFGENPKAPSRFFDKSLMIDIFIITSPYSPKQFYDEIFRHKKTVDSFGQLQRRITFVQFMTQDYFEMQNYNDLEKKYISVEDTRQKNYLLEKLKKKYNTNGRKTYDKFNQLLTK
ncbi:Rep family protein [Lysinibacillus sp. NPDC058147]|uniref:Rep family protein n=1 Tax=unclassified Lysinibacillus TaxID=2636778 RepID=UPI0036D838EC